MTQQILFYLGRFYKFLSMLEQWQRLALDRSVLIFSSSHSPQV
jgi:hypothetical protein